VETITGKCKHDVYFEKGDPCYHCAFCTIDGNDYSKLRTEPELERKLIRVYTYRGDAAYELPCAALAEEFRQRVRPTDHVKVVLSFEKLPPRA
jgi:hypothetical protein